jgi:transposase
MAKALSMDLRVRVHAAVSQGLSHRAAVERLGVSAASISSWRKREREQGDARPGALGGDRRSARIDAHKSVILEALGPDKDATIEEIRQSLAKQGLFFCFGTIQLFFVRHKITRKKSAHACEQDRPDVVKRRQDRFDGQLDLDPARLVLMDEAWASTNMTRCHGRCVRGQRLRFSVLHRHWKTTAVIEGLTLRGFIAPFVIDRPVNRITFEAYVEKVLLPELWVGDIVVMDDLSSHKRRRMCQMIQSVGARLPYLSPYSSDFNPIENAFSKLRPSCERPPSGPSRPLEHYR